MEKNQELLIIYGILIYHYMKDFFYDIYCIIIVYMPMLLIMLLVAWIHITFFGESVFSEFLLFIELLVAIILYIILTMRIMYFEKCFDRL